MESGIINFGISDAAVFQSDSNGGRGGSRRKQKFPYIYGNGDMIF